MQGYLSILILRTLNLKPKALTKAIPIGPGTSSLKLLDPDLELMSFRF